MYNQPPQIPFMDYYYQHPYYFGQQFGYDLNDVEMYRPEVDEDFPTTPPPSQMPAIPATFSSTAQSGQMRAWMCQCLGKWGFLGLRLPGPLGRDLWFYPTEVRKNGVSGYVFQGGRSRKVSYRYSQIRNFMCFA